MSRYFAVSEGLIEKCQQGYLTRRDLERTVPHLSANDVAIMAIESLEADRLLELSPAALVARPVEGMGDWAFAVLAEIYLLSADQAHGAGWTPKEDVQEARDRAWTALEKALDSPTASPMLWYQDIYLDVAQRYRINGDLCAAELMKRGLAHDLRHNEGDNAEHFVRDLAEIYLWLDELDRGLAVFSKLLHNDPGDVWTYNAMAFTLGHVGLADLGLGAAQRGLELVDATGDPEELCDQLADALADLRNSERRGREAKVNPSVLADVRAALALDFDAGRHKSILDLCKELVPDLDRVPVKRKLEISDLAQVAEKIRQTPQRRRRLQRNDPCPCGSGKKHKRCCMRKDRRH